MDGPPGWGRHGLGPVQGPVGPSLRPRSVVAFGRRAGNDPSPRVSHHRYFLAYAGRDPLDQFRMAEPGCPVWTVHARRAVDAVLDETGRCGRRAGRLCGAFLGPSRGLEV